MSKFKIGMVSLGCDKNRVDSEIILGKINNEYEIVNNPKEAEVIIVNTCGFIESSKQESIDTILEMSKYKKEYNCKVLVVTGCLTQRYGKELLELMPEIDVMLGVNDYDKLNKSIEVFLKEKNKIYHCNYSDNNINSGERIVTTGQNTAYLRISEGCNNFCTYCIIPKIRGRFRSRTIEDIVAEAKVLSAQGVREIILVAQDTTIYGTDIYGEKKLSELLKQLAQVQEIKWIRLLYCYPEEINDELIREIANNKKVCKYLDIPIQHISNSVLKRMGRRSSKEQIIEIIDKLRSNIEDICIRTSLIVGFPGETEEEFNELREFIKDIEFDKLGVFKYSQEEGTAAAIMDNQIEEDIKEARYRELMLIQKKVSKNINQNKVNRIYEVLVENFDGQKYIGRNYEMSPDIDGIVSIENDKVLNIGEFVKVKITKALEYDLIGVVYYESCQ